VCEHDGEPAGLLDIWKGARVAVVVDSVRTGAAAGTVHRAELRDAVRVTAPAGSTHGLGLGEAVELARALDRLPWALVVFGIEAGDTGHGVGLSDAVAGSADRVAAEVVEMMDREAGGCA
jgi:hydrogenase maturation protease